MTIAASNAVNIAVNSASNAVSNAATHVAVKSAVRPDAGNVVERMIEMMSIIPRAPHWISTAKVHDRLEALGFSVDRRTVVRDLNKLSGRFGFERRGESSEKKQANGKRTQLAYAWRWPANASGIGAPVLTETEALTLVMVREHLAALLPPMVMEAMEPQFVRASARLKKSAAISGGLRDWNASVRVVQPTQPLGAPQVKHTVRDAICLALAARSQFTGSYRRRGDAQAKEYLFNPLGLVIRGQVTYLAATMWTYDDVRLYPLHRFERAQKEEARRFDPAGFDLDAYLSAQNGLGFASGCGTVSLHLRFHRDAGAHLRETSLADDQQITDIGEGVLEVTATVPETSQLNWWLLGFGSNVEVLAPAFLRETMKDTVQRMASRYA